MTAWNLSIITCTRGRVMFWQASAEPMIGPTRLARSRTTAILSPGAALAPLASTAPKRTMAQRGFRDELRSKARLNQ